MTDKLQPQDIRIRHVSAILEIGELLYEVLTPEEKRALQKPNTDIEQVEAKRRYRWNDASRRQ